MPVIDVDDPSSWSPEIHDHVEELAARLAGTTEHTGDLEIGPDEEDEFRATLSGVRIKAYHATRLLDHEVNAIQTDGLLPLSADLVRTRITAASEHDYLTDDERDELLARNVFDAGDEVSNRENQVCLFLSRGVLDHSVNGVWRLMTTWGGEGIYFGSGFTEGVKARLKSIGSPAVVVAAIELSQSWRVHSVFPGLLNSFVGRELELDPYDSDIFYRAPVPGDQILGIWLPGNSEYNQHPELPR